MRSFFVIFKKTMLDIFRDKSTYITLILSGIAFPVIVLGMSFFLNMQVVEVTLGINSGNNNIGVEDYLQKMPNQFHIHIVKGNTEELIAQLRRGEIDCFVNLELENRVDFLYNSRSYHSFTAASRVGQEIQSMYSKEIANRYDLCYMYLCDETGNENGILKSILMIFFPSLLVYIFSRGISGYADELFAGEKERKTLEWLLLSGISRKIIYFGKCTALLSLNILSISISAFSFLKTIETASDEFLLSNGLVVFRSTHGLVLCILLLASISLIMMVMAVLVSIFSFSIRESQVINSLFSMIPVIVTVLLTINQSTISNISVMRRVPFIGLIVCLIDIFQENISISECLIAIGISMMMILTMMIVSIRRIEGEKIVL